MEQEILLEETARDNWADADEIIEDRLNEEQPWEIAFEQGERMANKEMVDDWLDEDEFE